MGPGTRRRVLIGLLLVVSALFVGGIVAAWVSRDDTICRDGRPPAWEQPASLGQTRYLCNDGEIVKK